MNSLPSHVRSAFHAEEGEVSSLGLAWDCGWLVGSSAIIQVVDSDNASLSAKLRERLKPDKLRLARPIRSTDGRYVVSGWRASTFSQGELQTGRVDETVLAALRLADCLREEKIPEWLKQEITGNWTEKKLFAAADRLAWSDDPMSLLEQGIDEKSEATSAMQFGLTLAHRLHPLIPPVPAPVQLEHADMLATTVFSASSDPLVTELVLVARPHGYGAALAIVDGLLNDAVDTGIIGRFSSIPDIMALLLRALLYRTYVHALHPRAVQEVEGRLTKVADTILKG